MGVEFRNGFPAIRSGLQEKAERIVDETTRDIQRGAMERSRVDTGQMRGGWDAVSEGLHGEVINPVEHTIFNEYGTVHMSAQPMAGPAAEEERPRFEERMRGIVGP